MADVEDQVWGFKIAGSSDKGIADSLGITVDEVRQYIDSRISKTSTDLGERADEARIIELERLERMVRFAWTDAEQGSNYHIGLIMKISQMRLALFGIDVAIAGGTQDSVQVYLPEMDKDEDGED
jgi:hypothetical protein